MSRGKILTAYKKFNFNLEQEEEKDTFIVPLFIEGITHDKMESGVCAVVSRYPVANSEYGGGYGVGIRRLLMTT